MSSDMTAPYSDEEFARLQAAGRDHLWMHFTRHSAYEQGEVPVIVRGEGAYIYDAKGKRYLDGLAGLFVVQARPRPHRARRGRRQAGRASWPSSRCGPTPTRRPSSWPSGSPTYAPGDLNRVFFTTGGGEAVETRVEAGQAVLQAHRQADEAQGDQPRDRLPRHPAGRAVDHRPARR